MLDTNFVEEYYRIENDLTTNNETIYIDRENKIILTHPFFTDAVLDRVRLVDLGVKGIPRSLNVIVDAITFYSTNPKIQNFLPLKLGIGTKSLIEFNDPSFTVQRDYKILTEKRLNLNTIGNRRYTSPKTTVVTGYSEFDEDPLLLIDIVQQRNNIYISVNDTEHEDTNFLVIKGKDNIIVGESNEPISLWGNNFYAIEYIQPELFIINEDGSKSKINIRIANSRLLNLLLFDRIIIIITRLDYGDRDFEIFFVSDTDVIGWYTDLEDVLNEDGVPGFFSLWSFDPFSICTYYIRLDEIKIWNNVASGFPRMFRSFKLPHNFAKVKGKDLEVSQFFQGGTYSEPRFTFVLRSDNEEDNIYLYFTNVDTEKDGDVIELPILNKDFGGAGASTGRFKQYSNQIYCWVDDLSVNRPSKLVIINLDTSKVSVLGDNVTGSLHNIFVVYNISDYGFLIGGSIPLYSETSALNYTEYGNDRLRNRYEFNNTGDIVTVNEVYRLSQWYDQRAFLFDRSDQTKIFLQLPEQASVADMEIFKYTIDIRIRFTKENVDVYQVHLPILEREETEILKKRIEAGDVQPTPKSSKNYSDFDLPDFLNP